MVKTPRVVAPPPSATVSQKRRRREDGDRRRDHKRPKLDYGHRTPKPQVNGVADGDAHDGVNSASDNNHISTHSLNSQVSGDKQSILNKQMSMAKRSGKVKTTQELIENLGIDSKHSVSPPVPHNVNSLVPNENKEELMNRFFESQQKAAEDDDDDSAVEIISRPATAIGTIPSSTSNSLASSRANTPHAAMAAVRPTSTNPVQQSVEEVLAQLSPIDPAAVLAEWADQAEEEEEDIEGLIPVFKPTQEITDGLIKDLNEGQLEHIGGVTDHAGEFKEWHEVVSKESLGGELIHILPYSAIDWCIIQKMKKGKIKHKEKFIQ